MFHSLPKRLLLIFTQSSRYTDASPAAKSDSSNTRRDYQWAGWQSVVYRAFGKQDWAHCAREVSSASILASHRDMSHPWI